MTHQVYVVAEVVGEINGSISSKEQYTVYIYVYEAVTEKGRVCVS